MCGEGYSAVVQQPCVSSEVDKKNLYTDRTVGRAVEGDDEISKGREQTVELTLGKEVDTTVETDKEEV